MLSPATVCVCPGEDSQKLQVGKAMHISLSHMISYDRTRQPWTIRAMVVLCCYFDHWFPTIGLIIMVIVMQMHCIHYIDTLHIHTYTYNQVYPYIHVQVYGYVNDSWMIREGICTCTVFICLNMYSFEQKISSSPVGFPDWSCMFISPQPSLANP